MGTLVRPWDIRLWLYPLGSPAGDPTTWGLEQDISSYVKFPGSEGGQSIQYRAGRRGESAVGVGAVDASEMNLSLDNKDGRFCPDNVMSPYWPNLDINTPIRMGVVTGYDDFNRPAQTIVGPSSSGQAYTQTVGFTRTGTAAALTIPNPNATARMVMTNAQSTNWDITVTTWAAQAATGNSLVSAVTQFIDFNNYVSLGIDFGISGTAELRVHRVAAGTFTTIRSVPLGGATYTPNERFIIRAMRDGTVLYLKAWKEVDPQPAAWTTSVSENLIVGGNLGVWAWRTSANTNTGIQFGWDNLTIVGLEFTGYVTEWPTDWDMTGRNSWAAIKSSGILRRLRQAGTGSFQSPLRRQLTAYNPAGYWPMEDGARALTFGNVVEGQQPAKFKSMNPASDITLPGASQSPTLTAADGSITAYCTNIPTTQGFAVMFLAKPTPNPSVKTRIGQVLSGRGPIYRFDISLNMVGGLGVFYLDGYDTDGNLIASNQYDGGGITDWSANWHAFCLTTDNPGGGNYHAKLLRYRLGDPLAWYTEFNYASTVAPQARVVNLGGTSWSNTSFAHLGIYANTLPFVSYPFFNAATGFNGELAVDRINRIGAQANIPVAIEPGNMVQLGPQPRLRPVEIMQVSADADYGLMYETGNGLGVRPRQARRNQPVRLTLSVPAGQIAQPPNPVRDDQRVRNNVTVQRDGGSLANAIDPVHIARVGEYEDTVTLNLYNDDDLSPQAQFRLFVGTRPRMRWSNIAIDFATNPGLLTTWRARTYGFRMQVITGRPQVTGAEPDLTVDGFSANLDPLSYTVSLECSDATVWDVGVWDDATTGRTRWGPTGATLNAAVGTADTSIPVLSTETWRTGTYTPPLMVSIDGETISVDSVSGPASNVYTLTVTPTTGRAVNSVVKSHAAGAAVTFANQRRWGF